MGRRKNTNENFFGGVRGGTDSFKPIFSEEQLARLRQASDIMLGIMAVLGLATVTVLAPNALRVFKIAGLFRKQGKNFEKQQRKIANTFYYLKRNGLIEFEDDPRRGIVYRLTRRGRARIKNLSYETLRIPRPKDWNKKWWLVAADIPTKDHRGAADAWRRKLKNMQFYPLQRTLWVYPYDPRQELEFLSNYFHIGEFVTVMEVSRIDVKDEKKIKEHFSL